MAKAKKGAGKKGAAAKGAEDKVPKREKAPKPAEPKVSREELESLREPVEEAKSRMDVAKKEAESLAEQARTLVSEAKKAYQKTLVPYREACRKADIECEYEGGRSANVTEKVYFLVEKTEKGVRVTIKGRPDTEEAIPLADLKESVSKAAYAYTDKHLGSKDKIGNKGGGLSNRLRAAITS